MPLFALAPACQLVTVGAHGAPGDALARLGTGWRPPALVTGAVSADGVALTVAGTFAGVLAQLTPAIGVAGALASDGVTATMWVALAHLATV